jgi:hypothetical protein
MKRKTVLLTLLILLLLAHGAQAMSSINFNLNWLVPLTSSGGGPASSVHYAANFTVGQTVINASSSTNYAVGLGYWYGILPTFRVRFQVRLPIIIK